MLSSIHCHCNWPVIHPQLNQLATAATAALLLGALPAAAAPAQQPRHWYATLAAGALQPQNQSGYVETHYGYAISGSVQRSAGFNGEAGIGYSFGAIRTELTYAYTSNSLVSSQASAMGISEKTKGLSGYTTTNAFLGSAYWDFNNKSRFTP